MKKFLVLLSLMVSLPLMAQREFQKTYCVPMEELMTADPCAYTPSQSARSACKEGNMICEYGNPSVLSSNSDFAATSDFSEVIIEGKENINQYLQRRGEDWVKDWPGVVSDITYWFAWTLSHKNKKGLHHDMKKDNQPSPYLIVICPSALDMGSNGASIASSIAPSWSFKSNKKGGAHFTGSVVIYDTATGKVVCSFYGKDIQSDGGYNETWRLRELFNDIAKKMVKAAKN